MGRTFRILDFNGTIINAKPRMDKVQGPPYHFKIFINTEHLDKIIQGGQLVTFEEWGTSCCDCWTWFQQPVMIFEQVVFEKYEHVDADYTVTDNYVSAYFTADNIWQVNGTLMEEVSHEHDTNWNLAPRSPSLHPSKMKKMAWQEDRAWKLEGDEWVEHPRSACHYEARSLVAA